ncbi:DUF2489 domain-containing protein [Marinomonas pollencensis]|uniref:Uncharacterized protein DUF2489 n=1 Tax=Marinomonas pollencensis TaxID=491954 RepID=A0A3E0DFG0_9GAMM|nr:DUF2489 domain-containing protein [Marinomonas pollencensis]REG81443.1 uncharacterized protein DUF2489 [Marinomonas pollencensis]
MSFTAFILLLVASVAVIAASLWFIFRQLKLNRLRESRIREGESFVAEERQKRIESIQILLKAVTVDEKLTWIETSIRVKNLLDQLSIDLSQHDDISAFYIITEKTEHIPTHEQWKSLPKEARNKFSKEMMGYETEHLEHLKRAKAALLDYSFDS